MHVRVLTVVLATLALAAPASASTLSREGSTLVFTASPGELNNVAVFVENGEWVIGDRATIQLQPASGCTNPFGEEAHCGGGVSGLRAALGDGDDSFNSQALPGLDIDGGDGVDTMTVASADDPAATPDSTLRGGAGNDILTAKGTIDGGGGDDVIKGSGNLLGGAGADQIEGTGTLDGGDGDDLIKGGGTSPDAGNTMRGGPGNDRIEGFGVLDGGPGNDRLEGAPTLIGGDGDDVLDSKGYTATFNGGPGRDIINSTGRGSTVDCAGGGGDLVNADGADSKVVNCGGGANARIALQRTRLKSFLKSGTYMNVTCDSPCAINWTLVPGDRRTAKGVHTGGGHLSRGVARTMRIPELDASFPRFESGTQKIKVRALGRSTKKALGRMRRISVKFVADVVDSKGVHRTVSKKFRIRR